jgi:NADH:ubiquinone reductase (H+-translocating)
MAMTQEREKSRKKHCVVIVGAGFAGFNAARQLSSLVGATTEIVVINSTDYFLYLPLMPQVAGGLVEPRHVCVSLPRRLPKVRFVLGTVGHVDPPAEDGELGRPGRLIGRDWL